MLSQVTVTPVAASLAVVSALFALVLGRYGIPRAARSGQEPVGVSTLMVGNIGLVMVFLLLVALCISWGIDPPLVTSLFPTTPGCSDCGLTTQARMVGVVQMTQPMTIPAKSPFNIPARGAIARGWNLYLHGESGIWL